VVAFLGGLVLFFLGVFFFFCRGRRRRLPRFRGCGSNSSSDEKGSSSSVHAALDGAENAPTELAMSVKSSSHKKSSLLFSSSCKSPSS
jgi:hypothetical protein